MYVISSERRPGMYITNSFSLNMLTDLDATIHTREIAPADVAVLVRDHHVYSAIGHADTAAVVSDAIGVELPANRATIKLEAGVNTQVIVAQYLGPRLPEGATTLPEGAAVRFIVVTVALPRSD